ncbi:uncharacterized protein FOMMEDRAFT_22261 [Fomitiporia mediterranea MF3/22]|uniref:uncharacterized protein n=1 Tax=Fomitiporia mediterranea (strain MF3/22) TaxID=694068 RepID=UPI00044094F7|nr:uncharacterized protein FOMMEDRAFT_22261 [Fomitiporia mediterranea MF3/22]EJD00473.1 hypothetical protein FOMMEDRAFT_22261 [Fomitiporia mediterranea MF3/22]
MAQSPLAPGRWEDAGWLVAWPKFGPRRLYPCRSSDAAQRTVQGDVFWITLLYAA